MKEIKTFKALSYDLLIFGYKPIDLVIILILFVFVHGVGNSLLIDIIFLILAFIVAKKGKNRPKGYFRSLVTFLIVPNKLSVSPHSEEKLPKDRVKE